MLQPIIRVQNLGKKYSIYRQQHEKYVSLRDVVSQFPRGVKNRLIGRHRDSYDAFKEDFWALQDISFEVQHGDRIGIVGRNGAGKSTLLKLLSQITPPSTGLVEMRGRVSSLLEVGTGFHPELTGRENIFLNGAILGMTKREIKKRFNEIVEFSGVEKFVDTPVKRYSSGMYVRLAFSVAAHLEPEILIIDEVLAVGDIGFQKKCLNHMKSISEHGTTILFVSHNIPYVKSVCNRGILFENGRMSKDGDIDSVIETYVKETVQDIGSGLKIWNVNDSPEGKGVHLEKVCVFNHLNQSSSRLDLRHPFSIEINYRLSRLVKGLRLGFLLKNAHGVEVCGSNDFDDLDDSIREPGRYISKCTFPGYLLNEGLYSVRFGADIPATGDTLFRTAQCLQFEVEDIEGHGLLKEKLPGVIRPPLQWQVSQVAYT